MPNIFDDDFSKLEHEGWTRVSSQYHDTWSNLTKPFIAPLLQAIQLKPGMKVLDVACGPGYVSENIYRQKAIPTALDFSASMLAICNNLHPHIETVEGDAQRLAFPDSSFDGVVMNFGMLHLAQPHKAMQEAFRVLKKGGRYAFTIWMGPSHNPMAKMITECIMRHADQSIEMPKAPPYDLFGDPELCKTSLAEAGFNTDDFQFKSQFVNWRVPTADYYFETEIRAGVRTASFLRQQTDETLVKIKNDIRGKMKDLFDGEAYVLTFCGSIVSVEK